MAQAEKLTGTAAEPLVKVNLRQHINALLSPEAQHVLDLRYQEIPPAVIITGAAIPCAVRPTLEANLWQFLCPWWEALLPEDGLFEQRLLTEVGKVQQQVEGMLQHLDLSKVN